MSELVSLVEEAPAGGFLAKALGASIFTEADSLEELRTAVRDSVACHCENQDRPNAIRLQPT
jgi:hypothetical protein